MTHKFTPYNSCNAQPLVFEEDSETIVSHIESNENYLEARNGLIGNDLRNYNVDDNSHLKMADAVADQK